MRDNPDPPVAHKLNILILWRGIPTAYDSSSVRIFHLAKHSPEYGHNLTLLTHDEGGADAKDANELGKFGTRLDVMAMGKSRVAHTLKETLLSPGLLLKRQMIPTFFYSRETQRRIKEILARKKFDIVYVDRLMLPYALDINLPKVIDIVDPVLYSRYQLYLNEKHFPRRMRWLLSYYHHRISEVPKYKDFDASVFVSSEHVEMLRSYLSQKVFVIPFGVDLDYFKASGDTAPPNLIFTGRMSYEPNIQAICYFCSNIYPLIKKRVPEARICIVGKEPPPEVLALASDPSVTVTGFVEEVKPYFSEAAVSIVPMVTDDGGFKVKILEAMAMGKPVVATSIGARGIEVTPGENIIIADTAVAFAEQVSELLSHRQLRQTIGAKARKFVENNYSWEVMTRKLFEAFGEIIRGKA